MPLVELPGFDQAVTAHKWTGSTAVAVYTGSRACSRCGIGEVVRVKAVVQLALFYHGGYGAAERRHIDLCLACGRVSVAGYETLNPRRFPPAEETE